MPQPALAPTNWRIEYENNTELWEKQCAKRWRRAEELITAGYRIIILPPLQKRALPRSFNMGIHQAFSDLRTLRMHTAPGGDHRSGNYGIVTGMGTCIVLDLDQGEDQPGEQALVGLESKYSFFVPRQCLVSTPSGGTHIYLAYDSDLAPRIRPFGQAIGIDILSSNGDKACRHAVGPGSVTESGTYEENPNFPILSVSLLSEYQIPAGLKKIIPTASNIVDLKGKPVYAGSGRGNESVGTDDVYTKMTLADLIELLDSIPVKDLSFDEWLRVGMAIHRERDGDGFELWNEWSAGDPDRYNVKACQSHWETFDNNKVGGVTIGTAINIAQKHGYRVKPAQHTLSMLDRIQSETPNAYLGGQCKFIRVTADGEVQEMGLEDVKSWYAGERILVNGRPTNPINAFMSWPGRIKHDRYELCPPPVKCPPTTVNVWQGYNIEPTKGDVSKYLELFDQMIPPDIRDWVHDWFADLIQNTGIKPPTALVFQGPEGTGKNTLIDVFRSMFKEHNTTHFVSTEQFVSRFNKHLARSVLAVVNEAVWAGNHKHASILKGYVSEDKFELEEKNIKSFQVRNCTRFVVMTNDEWSIPAERTARRFCVCKIDKARPSSDPWWKDTRRILKDKSTIAAVMHWYRSRTITNNLHRVPETDALIDAKRITKHKFRPGDKEFVDVTLHLAKKAHAVERVLEDGSKGYAISSNMIKNAYLFATGNSFGSDSWIWRYKQWLERNLNITVSAAIKTKHKSVQRQASLWPSLREVVKALAEFEYVTIDDIDTATGEWTSDDIEW